MFSCRLIDPFGRARRIETFEAERLAPAQDRARRLLDAHPDCAAAELRRDGRLLARLSTLLGEAA